MTFEEDELGIPLKEKPAVSAGTPSTAEKKMKKGQSSSVISPVPKPVDGTPPNKTMDPNSPAVQCKTPINSKELPSTPIAVRKPPVPSLEEKKPMQPSSSKANQPRRVTLNTLQAWSKAPR